jgi:hypothetical protein
MQKTNTHLGYFFGGTVFSVVFSGVSQQVEFKNTQKMFLDKISKNLKRSTHPPGGTPGTNYCLAADARGFAASSAARSLS